MITVRFWLFLILLGTTGSSSAQLFFEMRYAGQSLWPEGPVGAWGFDYLVCTGEKTIEDGKESIKEFNFREGAVYFPLRGYENCKFEHLKTCRDESSEYSSAYTLSIVIPLSVIRKNADMEPLLHLIQVQPNQYVSHLFQHFMSHLKIHEHKSYLVLIPLLFLVKVVSGTFPLVNFDSLGGELPATVVDAYHALDKEQAMATFGITFLRDYWETEKSSWPEEEVLKLVNYYYRSEITKLIIKP